MEEALLHEREEEDAATWGALREEVKKVTCIALPMILVTVFSVLACAAPIIMLGHIDELSMASSSIANSFCNVTGFSLLECLVHWKLSAGKHMELGSIRKLGSYTYCAIISLVLVCIPVSILWIFVEDILIFLGQDASISQEAGNYAVWMIITLFPYAILQSLNRFLQTQSLIFIMVLTSLISICFHLPVCWGLVLKLKLGNPGAAISVGSSYSLNTILVVLYVKYSPTCENTWVPLSSDVFRKIGEIYRLTIPSAVMVFLEWWSFELVILFSGLLPNPQLETSVLSICYYIISLHFFIPYSFSVAVSTRVSNELGAGNPQRAKIALNVVAVLAGSEFVLASAVLFLCRHILGYGFSNQVEVVEYVRKITPLLCLSIIVDSIQIVLSGVSRGSGWQHIGAYINLGSYYIIGIPLSLVLGFSVNMKGPGLWIGLVAGAATQASLLSLITCLTDWRKQATEARERVMEKQYSSLQELLE